MDYVLPAVFAVGIAWLLMRTIVDSQDADPPNAKDKPKGPAT